MKKAKHPKKLNIYFKLGCTLAVFLFFTSGKTRCQDIETGSETGLPSVSAAMASEAFLKEYIKGNEITTGGMQSGKTITIKGYFLIDRNCIFNNAHVLLAEGATIAYDLSKGEIYTLEIKDSRFHAADKNKPWHGIIVPQPQLLKIENSFIEDCEIAISSENSR